MMEPKLSIVDIILIAGTRVALGIGIGLLASNEISRHKRKTAGLVLALIGGLSTVPLALRVARAKAPATTEVIPAA